MLFWVLQCVGWLAFGAAMFYWGLSHWGVGTAAANKGILVATGFLLTLGFRWAYRRARAAGISLSGFALLVAVLSFGGAAVWIEAQAVLFSAYNGDAQLVEIVPGSLLYHGFGLLAWSLLYYGINAWSEVERERARAVRAEALAREARLRALQSQLEPHFLFNTLNAISTLVVEGQNSAATRMLSRLSEFLRLTLDATDTPEITVAEELEFARRYLEIEQVRFGDRLHATIEASDESMNALVPVMLLQPLLENAVKHGALVHEGGGVVAVAIERDGESLRVSVADDGPGLAGGTARTGVGLTNTIARLQELYGRGSRLALNRSASGGLEVVVEIPFRSTPRPASTEAARR
jgi:signal transduction histidine kinase